jgi:hypothetical protein
MKRKLLAAGITLVGLTLALGSNAWAGLAGKGRSHDRTFTQKCQTPPGHHYGWEKRPKVHNRSHRQRPAVVHQHHPRRPVVKNHIHHHYGSDARQEERRFNLEVSVLEDILGVAVALSRTY